MSGAITRERGLAFRSDVVRTDLVDVRSTAGNLQFGGLQSGVTRYCFGCKLHRHLIGSNGHKDAIRWRCGECLMLAQARKKALAAA